jgi:hypothetical protein
MKQRQKSGFKFPAKHPAGAEGVAKFGGNLQRRI